MSLLLRECGERTHRTQIVFHMGKEDTRQKGHKVFHTSINSLFRSKNVVFSILYRQQHQTKKIDIKKQKQINIDYNQVHITKLVKR